MSNDDNVMTMARWAREVMGWKSAGMAYQARKEGRLVMAPDGRHVLAAESKRRYEETVDPVKQGVAERHARARDGEAPEVAEPADVFNYQSAKARREHWAAEREEMNARREAGELVELQAHASAFAAAGAQVRAALESWPGMLAPQLYGQDEAAIRRILAEQVEQVLNNVKHQVLEQARQQERGGRA